MLNVEVFIIVKNLLLFIFKNVLFYYTIGTTYITILPAIPISFLS